MDYMLWYQDDKIPLAERVSRAAAHYQNKHGRAPTRVLIPKGEDTTGVIGPTCVEASYVLPSHLWLGVD